MSKNVLIAILAAVIIVAAGAVIVVGNMDDDKGTDDRKSIELKDSNGETLTYNFNEDLSRICVVSSNCMEWVQILGMSDMVVSACDLALTEDTLDSSLFAKATNVGATASASVESIVNSKAQLVITPAKSGLAADKQAQLKDTYGIPTIVLQCYGETMIEDAKTLVKIAGTKDAEDKFNGYMADRNSVLSKVQEAAAKAAKKNVVMSTVNSKVIKFYLPTSEMGKILAGLNVNYVPLAATTSSTVYTSPSWEKIVDLESTSNAIDISLVRTMSSYDLLKVYNAYVAFFKDSAAYNSMTSVVNKHVYSVEADITSGCMDYIGQVMLCQVMGYDIDLKAGVLVDEFQNKYNFKGVYENFAYDGTNYYNFR